MPISNEQVRRIATLASLNLTDSETAAASRDLAEILGYVSVLKQVSIPDVSSSAPSADLSTADRIDAVEGSLSGGEALRNAAVADGRFFIVPRVIDR